MSWRHSPSLVVLLVPNSCGKLKHLVQIKTCLEGIGYQAALFSDAVGLWTGEGRAALVVHSRLPKDLRTAAFAVYDGRLGTPDAFATVRATDGQCICLLPPRQAA